MNPRMKIYLVILFGLTGVATFWSLNSMLAERAAAQAAASELEDCHCFEAEIVRLRAKPALAAERERRSAEVTGPIERAAQAAGISADRLVRISPEPAQRVGETAYKEKPTRVFLKNVSLEQVVAMAYGLSRRDEGLGLKSMRLTAPSREATTGLWSAELVFVYLIYEPQHTNL